MLILVRVGVVGAGIGGLVLAQALTRAGHDVLVWDRDRAAADTGGYRLHLNARACATLRQWLAPELHLGIVAAGAPAESFRQFAVTTHRLRVLACSPRDGESLLIERVPLRELLCSGLEDRVRFGQTFQAYAVNRDGSVDVSMADAPPVTVDVLVGADGVGSRVAAALAGRPTSQRLGLGAVAGRTSLDEVSEALVPRLLDRGPALAIGPGGVGMFLTRDRAELIWSVLGTDARYPDDIRGRGVDELPALADALLPGWDHSVRELVRRARVDSPAYFSFSAADPTGDLTPWEPGPVTALGDAVHAMPPTGGQAAATAIRDAGVLAGALERVGRGDAHLAGAVGAYEEEMTTYAGQAVAESLAPVRWIRALDGPLAASVSRAVLPVAANLAAAWRRFGSRECGD